MNFPIPFSRSLLLAAIATPFLSACNSTPANSVTTESAAQATPRFGSKELLGRALFFDGRLSSPAGQSCASCHSPIHGFSQPDQDHATAEGAKRGLFGNRNVPTIAYAQFTPKFHKVTEEGETLYVGGFFLDGRESSLEAQALKPMLNPVEMGNKDIASLIKKIIDAGYKPDFEALYGKNSMNDTNQAALNVANAIASFERTSEVSPFSSKYDAYLAGKTELSPLEKRGMELFNAENKGNCAACHPSKLDKETGFPPLFTDHTYDNLGVPSNPHNPFLTNPAKHNPAGTAYKDMGLGEIVKDKNENGKFKVPTLRNIALTAPYMHNGVFETLEEVVAFYNTRDTDKKWGAPEVIENVNKDELGDLKLKDDEIKAIVSFMKTLSDGYKAE